MKNKKTLSFERRQARSGYIFCLPFIIGFILFVGFPLIKVIGFSFHNLFVGTVTYDTEFVGLEHYNRILFVDPDFRKTVVSSIGEMLFNVPVVVMFSFFIASLLNQRFIGRTVFRAILFLPVVFASGLVTSITSGDFISNNMQNIGSLSGESNAMFAGTFTDILLEMDIGNGVVEFIEDLVSRIEDITTMAAVPSVIFLSGMQSISPSVFEASYIEGASGWDVFWKITFPMVSPLVLVNIVYCIVDSFTSATNTAITSIHNVLFVNAKYGLGSAMAIFYLAIVGVFIAVVFVLIRRLVYYYD
ncbi:MAG: sugar ABC transporter permease [Clostridia bacterium]|nr:sugar ABC transporter permease [Clostridia bacterium]